MKLILEIWQGSEYEGGDYPYSLEGDMITIQNELFELAFATKKWYNEYWQEAVAISNKNPLFGTTIKEKEQFFDKLRLDRTALIEKYYTNGIVGNFIYQGHTFEYKDFITSKDDFNCNIYTLDEYWEKYKT